MATGYIILDFASCIAGTLIYQAQVFHYPAQGGPYTNLAITGLMANEGFTIPATSATFVGEAGKDEKAMMRNCVLSVCIGLYLCSAAHGTIIRVPDDYPTIQEGLNAASSGDTVLVAPGTYHENIVWPNANGIKLLSEFGADTTVVDGDSSGSVIDVSTMVAIDTTTVVRGFTIQNGLSPSGGGGIYLVSSSPKIADNTIEDNSASVGGGIYCWDCSSPEIVGNTIRANSASYGGGIHCYGDADATITDNTIDANSATGGGGGIHCHWSNPTISSNTIAGNLATSWGGGMLCEFSVALVDSNRISGNSAAHGGGICCWGSENPTIAHNAITGNSAYISGGAICCVVSSNPTVRYNIIGDNTADSLGDGIYCIDESFPVVDSNSIYNNGYGAYNADSSQMLVAEYNWWGDPSGPYHPTLNPGGLGDSTNLWVDPVPWLTDPVGVEEELTNDQLSMTKSQLFQNCPNPFSRVTLVRYQCPQLSRVTLKVYNSAGQEVATLVDRVEAGGGHSVRWDASGLRSGVYFYRMTIGEFAETRKCLLVR